MSRIGKVPIEIPAGVTVSITDQYLLLWCEVEYYPES